MDSQLLGQGASVHAIETGNIIFFQIIAERFAASPVADDWAQLANDEAANHGRLGLIVFCVHAIIAYHRGSHGHDLAKVGRVR